MDIYHTNTWDCIATIDSLSSSPDGCRDVISLFRTTEGQLAVISASYFLSSNDYIFEATAVESGKSLFQFGARSLSSALILPTGAVVNVEEVVVENTGYSLSSVLDKDKDLLYCVQPKDDHVHLLAFPLTGDKSSLAKVPISDYLVDARYGRAHKSYVWACYFALPFCWVLQSIGPDM